MNSTAIVVQTLGLLLGMSALLLATIWLMRGRGAGRARGPLRLLGQLPLEPRKSVYLLEVGEQVLLLGASDAGLCKLAEMPRDALPQAPAQAPEQSKFSLIYQALQREDRAPNSEQEHTP